MSKLDSILAKAAKTMNLDIRSAREQCKEPRLFLDSCQMNYALGGGLVLGRAYMIYGPYSQGKTSIATYLASQVQKKSDKKMVVYMDLEYTLDLDHCVEMGLDVDNNFIILRPKASEDVFNLIQELAESGEVGLIIIDSLTSMESKAQLEDSFGGFGGSKGAIVMSSGMKKIIPYLYVNKCTLLMIAQERQSIGQMYGPDFTIACGGKAPLFYSSWNSRVTRTGDIVDPETKEVIGLEIRVRNTKSKLDNPKRDANLKLMFKNGIDSEEEYLDCLVNLGIVKKTGSMYEVEGDPWGMGKVRGIEAVKTFLRENKDIYEKVKTQVNEALMGHTIMDDEKGDLPDDLVVDEETGEIINMNNIDATYKEEG